jgi:hypothetical protein
VDWKENVYNNVNEKYDNEISELVFDGRSIYKKEVEISYTVMFEKSYMKILVIPDMILSFNGLHVIYNL